MPKFGQIVIGPPGCGKTTYCHAMKEYYQYFNRQTLLINLDPANEFSDKVNKI
jgi:broad-specificity NMP kinase